MNDIPEDDYSEDQFFTPEVQKPVQKPRQQTQQIPFSPPASDNPLAAYFRMPGLHVTLPTKGAFLPPGSYNPTIAGDIPVFPMRAQDELLLRNPDALMSGYALEQLIESCVPAIKTPRLISTPDLDVLLLAIRAATYGENMEVEVKCPKCGAEAAFDCHLPSIVSKMTYIDPINDIRLNDDLVVRVRPYNMGSAIKAALVSFNETRHLQSIDADTEERRIALNASYLKMNDLNIEGITDCIIQISAPTGVVTEREYLLEFVKSTSRDIAKQIENRIVEMNTKGIDKKVDAKCPKCEHEWSPEVEFDPTSFFDLSS